MDVRTSTLSAAGRTFQVRVHEERRRNCRVSIGARGISVRLPRGMPAAEMERRLAELLAWARERIEREPERHAPPPERQWRDGALLKAGGEEYTVRLTLEERRTSHGSLRGGELRLRLPWRLPDRELREHAASLTSRLLARRHQPRLEATVRELNDRHFGAELGPVRFKHQRSRWGSCSSRGAINISTRLLLAPPDVLEYVCCHELAHLKVRSHGPRFWRHVERAVPDYRDKVAWLRRNGGRCSF